LNVT